MAVLTQAEKDERAFSFLRTNDRGVKPRTHGITEIRGPYYSPLGKRHLEDILETMGRYVDALKFAGGSFRLMSRRALRELISLCHEHHVLVSTGGFIEHVLTQGPEAVNRYIKECKELDFDIVEVSSGFITLPADGLATLGGGGSEGRVESQTGSRHSIWRRWRNETGGT
jgi:phosphosulfolactate synthase (CoM biosynthesis protein A)